MKQRLKKSLALLLTLAMCLSLLPMGAMAADGDAVLVAGWTWTSHPFGANGTTATFANAIAGVSGTNANFTYSNVLNSTATTYTPVNSSIAVNQWQGGAQYWQISLKTTGYSGLTLSFDAFSSPTGPRDFKIQISKDGITWADVDDGAYQILTTAAATIKTNLPLRAGSVNIDNTETAYIKFQNTSTTSQGGGTVADTGTSRLYNIKINGTEGTTSGPEKTAKPTVVPPGGATTATAQLVSKSQQIEISAVSGATAIAYKWGGEAPERSDVQTPVDGKVATAIPADASGAVNLKAVVTAGTLDSMSDVLSVFYTTKLATPTATPSAGASADGTPVTLASAGLPAGGKIYYTIDGSDPTTSSSEYTAPFALNYGAESGVTVKALAVCDDYESSAVLTASYTKPVATPVTIAAARKAAVGDQVYIKGVITGEAGSSGIYVQDATGGICVYKKLADLSPLKIGDEVTVRGYITNYNGLIEVDKKDTNLVEILSTGNATPPVITPAPVTVAMINSKNYDGMLIKLTGVTLSTKSPSIGTQNHTITQSGASCTFRGNLASFAQGDILNIVGIASTYSNAVQLLARTTAAADNGVSVGTADTGTVGDSIDKLVTWSAAGNAASPSYPATGGVNQAGAILSTSAGVTPATSTARGFSSSGWDGGTDIKYWQIQFSTKGACDITVSATHSSSATGPSNFYAQYSVDGTNFFTVPGGTAVLGAVSGQTYGQTETKSLPLPPDANNHDNVYVRWVMGTDGQFGTPSKAVASSGTSQINGIIVAGKEYYGPDDVAPVKANPSDASPVKLGSSIVLTSATQGATVYYTTDGSDPTSSATRASYTTPIALSTLPATIKAYAVKGDKQSTVKILEYTQIKVGLVSSSKLDHSPIAPELDRVTLTADKGASIQYRITAQAEDPTGSGSWVDYTSPIALTADQFPVVLEAKATAEGCLDGNIAVFHFTLSAGEAKNYFGQLHSHTTYSDGAGTLESALDYIWNTARNNNVQFVSFTDHSNYFDGTALGGVNPADALYDMSKAPTAAQAVWKAYKDTVAAFNAEHGTNMLALGGFEMTWSGGPGHINTFNTPGIVTRNNTELNDKSNASKDLGMQNYYKLLNRPEGAASVSQFNHPGTTFGTFTEFSYWDPTIDQRISLVEVGNGEGAIGSGGYFPSYDEYTKALDKGWHVAPTNNQDNHKGHWGDANTARSVIYTNDFTEQGLYQAMKDRRVYATEDKNLDIVYTVNNMVMGSIIGDMPATLMVKGVINDPDVAERISKVELVANGGRVLKTWDSIDSNAYVAEVTLSQSEYKDYSYFYLRVTEADKDLAVTAPVWVGAPVLTGIASLTSGTAMPVIGEPIELTTSIFNNESTEATLTSISYSINGTIASSTTPGTTIPTLGSIDSKYSYMPTKAGSLTVLVTAVVTVNGKSSTYTKSININVLDPATMPYIGIDGSHYNEYVAGNYADSMGNFGLLAFSHNVRTNVLKTSEDLLAACANPKYKMLVLTVPSRRNGTALREPYKCYTDDEIAAIKTFAENGGIIVVAGWSDLYENYKSFPAADHMAAQQNKLLAAIGSSLRISDDACMDDTHNAGGSDSNKARLYLTNYNFANPLTSGIVYDPSHIFDGDGNLYTQVFSQYGGTTIYAVDGEGKPTGTLPASVSPIVSGFDTTYSADKDADSLGGESTLKYSAIQGSEGAKDCVLVAASETVTHANGKTSLVVAAGGAFMSNFEIKSSSASDNNAVLGYSNYNILENLIEVVNPTVITDIADVQAAPEGKTFTVEGVITSNASGFDKDTAFFDCSYVQDATGGVNVFPVAGNYRIGQKVRVTGVTSSYQGERQLAVTDIKVIDSNPVPVEPKAVTTEQAASGALMGQLIKIEGVVVSFSIVENTVQTIIVRDASGVDARVFIDGYITTGKDAALRTNLKAGNKITVVGLASYDNSFDGPANRIRIRDRADIVCLDEQVEIPAEKLTAPVASIVSGTVENGTKVTFTVPSGAKAVYKTTEAGSFVDVPDGGVVIEGAAGATVSIWVKATKAGVPDSNVVELSYTIKKIDSTPSTGGSTNLIVKPDDVKVGEKAVEVKLPSAGAKLNDAANEKVVAANADKPIVITGGGLTVTIPAGTLTEGTDVNALLVNPKATGSVIKVTKPDGTTSILPIATMNGGKAAYVANILGKYEVVDNAKTFPDTGDHWALPAIGFVSARELFKGDNAGAFRPDQPMTRGMLATVLARIDGGKASMGTPFADVSSGSWYAKEIAWAAQNNLVEGDGKNFNPDADLTREQLCVILIRYLNYSGLTLAETTTVGDFTDLSSVSPWAKDAMEQAVKAGLISGKNDGLLDPQGKATRAEISTILQRFVEGVLK